MYHKLFIIIISRRPVSRAAAAECLLGRDGAGAGGVVAAGGLCRHVPLH